MGVGFFSALRAMVAQTRRKQLGVTRETIPFVAPVPGAALFRPTPARMPCQVATLPAAVDAVEGGANGLLRKRWIAAAVLAFVITPILLLIGIVGQIILGVVIFLWIA
jgi:nitrate reductase NapE component